MIKDQIMGLSSDYFPNNILHRRHLQQFYSKNTDCAAMLGLHLKHFDKKEYFNSDFASVGYQQLYFQSGKSEMALHCC